jgi:PAS domain S-box-containing protein
VAITTPDGRFLDVNEAALRIFGMRKLEVLGRTSSELGLLDPHEQPLHASLAARVMREGLVTDVPRLVRSKTGKVHRVALRVETVGLDGASRLVSTFVDIGEQSLAAADARGGISAELRSREAQLREAQEVAHIGSWEMDLRTRVVIRSAELCRIFGVDEAEYGTGPTFSEDRIHPADRERFTRTMREAFVDGTPYEFECRIVRPDGEVRHLVARGRVERDANGTPIRLLGTGHDVSEQRRTEARLVLADRMASLGTLAAGVAHEINNPLSYVIANLDIAAEELRPMLTAKAAETFDELVGQAREGADRIRTIVRGLRVFSRADEERRTHLDPRQALDTALNFTRNEIRYRARVVKAYAPIPLVEADEARLTQVFINVLVNAAHAMPAGPSDANQIQLATATDAAGRATIAITDTGRGMPAEVAAHVFDPFFTTKPVGEGTGLGMSICHGIVTALGGEISVESEVGKGTVVRIALPAAP